MVPVALIDSYKVLDQKGSAPVTVQLHYLPPIPYEEYQGMKTMEIAVMVGYSSNSTFTRAFHSITGMTPKAYRSCSALGRIS